MSTAKEAGEINCKLAQFRMCLEKDLIKNKNNIKHVLDRLHNINCKIVATDYMQLYFAKCVGFAALHFAVNKWDLEAFDILLRHGADLTIKNSNGLTALHQVVEDSHCFSSDSYVSNRNFVDSIVSAHIRYNNYENPVNPDGFSHFHIACAVNNVDVVKVFLQHGVSVDHTVNRDSLLFPGFSPLHFAIKYNAFEVAEVLLSHSANIHIENVHGETPLYMAFERKLKVISKIFLFARPAPDKILKIFLEKESNDGTTIVNNWGLLYFHIACVLKDSKVAESYLQKVCNINHAVNVNSPVWPGYTAAHFAALCSLDTVKLLVERGADMSIKDAKGVTPFDICIREYKTEDIHAVISLNPIWKNIILSDGKTKLTDFVFAMRDPNELDVMFKNLEENTITSDSPLWPGYTPVHLAVMFFKNLTYRNDDDERNKEVLREFFEKNLNMLNSEDIHGSTPLHLAFHLEKSRMYRKLCTFLESLDDLIDHTDEDGLSYLHITAAINEPFLLERLLLIAPENVNAVYRGQPLIPTSTNAAPLYSGSTPLHFAVAYGSVEAAKMLVKGGADMCAKDTNHMTPVHLLMMNSEVYFILSSPNLRDSVVDGMGLSNLHVACWLEETEAVDRLLDVGANVDGLIKYQPSANSNKLSFLKKFDGCSPLLLAYKQDNEKIVEVLLQRGADPWVKDEGKAWLQRILELNTSNYFDLVVKIFMERVDLQARLKEETGMTKLHIACFICDIASIENLVNERANVNAQIRFDSPIFQGYTPLHVVAYVTKVHDHYAVDKVIKILVNAGADVTMPNIKLETAVHMAWGSINDVKSLTTANVRSKYNRVNMLLEAQRDFHVNPTNIGGGGVSHFHIACNVCNTSIVHKFLNYEKIDIDQTIDPFHLNVPGYSALHLAAGSQPSLCGAARQLRTIDLLLKNGANVHVEDAYGDTALHECARFNSLDLFERLVRGGADVNAKNACENMPLHYYLTSGDASVEGLKILLRFGCHLNVFNAVTGEGYLGVAACNLLYKDMRSFLDAIINFSKEIEADDCGRTIIHNIVSTDSPVISVYEYVSLIEQISETDCDMDCDIDRQDNSGRTALHMAVNLLNSKGVFGLLMIGADINATDANGKTAFAYVFDECQQCEYQDDVSDWFEEEDEEYEKTCKHLVTLKTLAYHVKSLQLCGLTVDKQNEELALNTLKKLNIKNVKNEGFMSELEIVKNIKIEPHALPLYDFLSENGAVADYPTMSQVKREGIDKFFSASEVGSFRKKLPNVAGIVQLQYRKARARPELVESAKNAVELLIGFRLPEICSQIIMVFLSNSELKSLIASTI